MNTRALHVLPQMWREVTHPHAPANWAVYHHRKRVFVAVAVALAGPGAAFLLAGVVLVPAWGIVGLVLPYAAWVLASFVAGLRWQASLCPRCEDEFFPQHPYLLGLASPHCKHCMLPKD